MKIMIYSALIGTKPKAKPSISNEKMNLKEFLFGKKNKFANKSLKECVQAGLITDEERLRILKDRAIEEWEKKVVELRVKKK